MTLKSPMTMRFVWIKTDPPSPKPRRYRAWMSRSGVSEDGEVWFPIQTLGEFAFMEAAWDGESMVEHKGVTFVRSTWMVNQFNDPTQRAMFARIVQDIRDFVNETGGVSP